MLEYFTYKKVKKHQADKLEKGQTPVLDEEDEHFLKRVISAEGTPPPLPERPSWQGTEAGDASRNRNQIAVRDGSEDKSGGDHVNKGKSKENEKTEQKTKRMSFLQRTFTKKVCVIVC